MVRNQRFATASYQRKHIMRDERFMYEKICVTPSKVVSLRTFHGLIHGISTEIKMADKFCKLLEGKEASDFVASMDTFIFDCDGKWMN